MTGIVKDGEFELTGGALCLDFANTLGDRPRSAEEHLDSYGDLLRFSRQTASLSSADLDELERLYGKNPTCARTVFRRVLEVREAIYRIFGSLARDTRPAPEDLATLNSTLKKALRQIEIQAEGGGFEWRWGGPIQALDRPLWPIARSAAELLVSDEVDHLRECASETCSWLFVDRSRGRRRRWCDMSTCGNRAKARRHYERRRRAETVD